MGLFQVPSYIRLVLALLKTLRIPLGYLNINIKISPGAFGLQNRALGILELPFWGQKSKFLTSKTQFLALETFFSLQRLQHRILIDFCVIFHGLNP